MFIEIQAKMKFDRFFSRKKANLIRGQNAIAAGVVSVKILIQGFQTFLSSPIWVFLLLSSVTFSPHHFAQFSRG